MAKEIERKYLVVNDNWRAGALGTPIRQGYLSSEMERTIRVRTAGDRAFLTIKSARQGIVRDEYEYEIPNSDAHEMLDNLCLRPLIEKTRFTLTHDGMEWIVDVFSNDNEGLIIAEVELVDENQDVALPDWVGQDVSDDPRYLNVNLSSHPFCRW